MDAQDCRQLPQHRQPAELDQQQQVAARGVVRRPGGQVSAPAPGAPREPGGQQGEAEPGQRIDEMVVGKAQHGHAAARPAVAAAIGVDEIGRPQASPAPSPRRHANTSGWRPDRWHGGSRLWAAQAQQAGDGDGSVRHPLAPAVSAVGQEPAIDEQGETAIGDQWSSSFAGPRSVTAWASLVRLGR